MMSAVEWAEAKGKIESKFKKLSDAESDDFDAHLDLLKKKVEKARSFAKKKARLDRKIFDESFVS
jgi:hypothetical protein